MRLRFKETVPSEAAGFPFYAGQIIAVPHLSPLLRTYVQEGRATVLDPPLDEAAVLGDAPESAVIERPRSRGRR